jgi:hypothetical protein
MKDFKSFSHLGLIWQILFACLPQLKSRAGCCMEC